jgi:hypothetical protein
MISHPDFVVCRPKNNYYHSLKHKTHGAKLGLDFRKVVENGKVIGYGYLDIVISPHYHFNQYRHNGNDFTPENSIYTVADILTYLGIKTQEYNLLKVVNIEFGLNLVPESDIKTLIDGLFFYKKTPFNTGAFPYYKKTDATSYKQIKAYAKGLQFLEYPQYGINQNTFRFEVKSKQAKNIKKYGITTAVDLLEPNTYKQLGQTLLNEWENVLLTNQTPDFSNLKPDEVKFIQSANKSDFWEDLKTQKHRNTFQYKKTKYYKILQRKNNLHTKIKGQIIDKIIQLSECANSTQPTATNRGKLHNQKTHSTLINLENAQTTNSNRVCLVTGLNISMQRKGSKYLCLGGLKYYREFESEIYQNIEKRFLTEKMRTRHEEYQMYYIAHNIRNTAINPNHNPKYSRERFEQRNYKPNQLQIKF